MPQEKKCIRCGTPSETAVCMPCFLKYDYRTYEPHILDADALETNNTSSKTAKRSTLVKHVGNQQPHDHNASPNQAVKQSEDNSISSWFSRLPHLS